jgi:hypothetical protein
MATIKIRRTNDYINVMRDYRLFIDNQKIGTISNGQTKDFDIPAGRHSLIAKIDWCSSQELFFEINNNETKIILVGALKHSKWSMPLIGIILTLSILLPLGQYSYYKLILILPAFIYILYTLTLGRKNYLTLKGL